MGKRMLWVDSLKGILIILVVFGHAIQETMKSGCFDNHLWNIIYSFHMPAFMAVSGYLNYQIGGGTRRLSTIWRRFQQLMIPFVVWAIIELLIKPPYSIESIVNVFLYPDGSFWFLWVLFFITVIFYGSDWIANRLHIRQEWIVLMVCLALAGLMVFIDFRMFGFQFIAYYFLFYTTGYYIHKYEEKLPKRKILLLVLTCVWAVLAWFWNMHKLPSFLSSVPLPQTMMQYAYRFVTALIAVYVLFGVSPQLLKADAPANKPFVRLGQISLGIYTTHILLMPFIIKGLMLLTSNTTAIIVASFVIGLVISWLLVLALSKWKVSSRILLGKL